MLAFRNQNLPMNGSNGNTAGANNVVIDAVEKTGEDCISNAHMQEIARRLNARVENRTDSDIWGGTEAPEDKTLLWWPKDSTTGVRLGQPKVWDAATEAWIALGSVTLPAYPKRAFRAGLEFVPAGVTVEKEFVFETIGTLDYGIRLTMTRKVGGTFLAAPANMNNFGAVVIDQTVTTFKVKFYNVPTDGLGVMWEIQGNALV